MRKLKLNKFAILALWVLVFINLIAFIIGFITIVASAPEIDIKDRSNIKELVLEDSSEDTKTFYTYKWSDRDIYYLHIIADLKGGDVEQRAYNIRVAINRSCNECRSIIAIVSEEMPIDYAYNESDINNEAYDMVVDGWDNTNGSLDWRQA